jgi:hypothetical protein
MRESSMAMRIISFILGCLFLYIGSDLADWKMLALGAFFLGYGLVGARWTDRIDPRYGKPIFKNKDLDRE